MDEYEYTVEYSFHDSQSWHRGPWSREEFARKLLKVYVDMQDKSGWLQVRLIRRIKPGPIEIVED